MLSRHGSGMTGVLLLMSYFFCDASICELLIRRNSVLTAWHSSLLIKEDCFSTRDKKVENLILGQKSSSFRFLLISDKGSAVDGFHWFAVQLKESVLIRSVTIKGREDDDSRKYNRANDIEIYTSESSSPLFTGSCTNREMGKQFNQSRGSWRHCGSTKPEHGTVRPGENFTVRCVTEVRFLLLRRNVTNRVPGSNDDGFMSFADLRLQTMEMKSNAPEVVAENSSFTVNCSLTCSGSEFGENSPVMELCSPNGTCRRQSEMEIVSAKPQDAGTYKCKVDSVEHAFTVNVLYPPSSMSISVMQNGTCKKPSDMNVTLMSAASHPPSEHSCRATAAGNNSRTVKLKLLTTIPDRSLSSQWSFGTHEELTLGWKSGTIECCAVQNLSDGIVFQNVLTVSAAWICRPESSGNGRPVKTAAIVTAAVLILVICIVIILLFFRKRRSGNSLMNTNAEQLGKCAASTSDENNIEMPQFKEPECTNLTVRPRGPDDSNKLQDKDNDCTVYEAIVADPRSGCSCSVLQEL